jgi:hypothetical protein
MGYRGTVYLIDIFLPISLYLYLGLDLPKLMCWSALTSDICEFYVFSIVLLCPFTSTPKFTLKFRWAPDQARGDDIMIGVIRVGVFAFPVQ